MLTPNRTWRSLALAVSVTLLTGFFATSSPSALALSAADDGDMISLINGERSAAGLETLTIYWDLEDDAEAQTARQIAAGNIFHTVDLAGVTTGWQALGENVGVGPNMTRLHDAFMGSSGHRANILGDYNYIGVYSDQDDIGQTYVTILFMKADPSNLKPDPVSTSNEAEEILTMNPSGITDVAGHIFAEDIKWLAHQGIAFPCDNDRPTQFCPDDLLAREEMATMLARGLDLPTSAKNFFNDDNSSKHEDHINAVAQAGITLGCNPPANNLFCPTTTVSRQQMASFFVRALDLPKSGTNFFTDDNASVHHADINALAESGITMGCNPPSNDRFCGTVLLTRGQIAAFLHRALSN